MILVMPYIARNLEQVFKLIDEFQDC